MQPEGEALVEAALLGWLRDAGWETLHGSTVAPGEPAAERSDYREVILLPRLQSALRRINPTVPDAAIHEAIRILRRPGSAALIQDNRDFHRRLVDGIEVELPEAGGRVRGHRVRLVDPDDIANNDWLAVNQFTVAKSPPPHRRFDIVLFLNGLPLAVVELKGFGDPDATIWTALSQLRTCVSELPDFFGFNQLMVTSDGVDARLGCLGASDEWFHPWRTRTGDDLAAPSENKFDVLSEGVFERGRFLDLIRHFIAFEDDDGRLAKRVAGYHQFHATRKAVARTLEAAAPGGDHRAGVVWHTQGSGKSLTMAFYAGKLVFEPAMRSLTIVVISDRNDLACSWPGSWANR